MSRRIDIELTSKSGDGSWTWRAAGARQPKGVVEGSLVPESQEVGSVLRAEVETGLDGIEVLALTAVKPARSPEKTAGRIEVVGTPKRAPDVSVILAPGSGKRSRRRDEEGDDRGERRLSRGRSDRPSGGPGGQAVPGSGPGGGSAGSGGGAAWRPGGGPEPVPVASTGPRRPEQPATRRRSDGRPARGERPVAPTSTVHRNAMLATLRPEQIPVAEQLLRGGLPAVRQAIDAQNSAAKVSGRPAASTDALLAMADELLPVVKLADWKDRATALAERGQGFSSA